MCSVPERLWLMQEASGSNSLDDSVYNVNVLDVSRCKLVTTFDDLVAADLYKGDSLGVTRFEAYRCASRDIKSVTMRSYAIKLQLRVCLDEVIMGSDLISRLA
jgi:hypothetical protein